MPFETSPAPAFNSFMVEGMSNITQCHHPLPVGASGSYMVIAKLLVPAGALLYDSCGEMFSPEHPNPLNTCVLVACPPTELLVRVNV